MRPRRPATFTSRLLVFLLAPVVMYMTFRAPGLDADVLVATDAFRVDGIDRGDAIRFTPVNLVARRVAIVPGCPADPMAYAPLARQIATRGFAVAIVRVPFRCAFLPAHEAELDARVMQLATECAECPGAVLAGHARGAVHALRIASRAPGVFGGLVLMGTTHPREVDHSSLSLPVMKIVGSEDGVAPLAVVERNRHLLPASTRWVVIEGGNHSQFAHYGFQLFDHRARITREAQQAQIVSALVGLFPSQLIAK